MFHLFIFLFSAILFFLLTPGILFTIPRKSSKYIVALVHGLVYAVIWHFTHKLVWKATEGFDTDVDTNVEFDSESESQPSLILNTNIKWSEKHTYYEDLINYILNNYSEIISFHINNNESTDNDDADIILTDNNNPKGVIFKIKYDDKLDISEIEKFLNDKGYSKNNIYPAPSSLL